MRYPAKTIDEAFRACDPAEMLEANDPRYVDFSAGRGDEGMAVSQCRKRIERSDKPLVQLLAGHRGCGKSTELRQLQQSLENSNFAVAFLDAEVDLDLEDTEPTDILLALIRGLEEALRHQKIHLTAKLLEDFEKWFADVVVEKSNRIQFEAEVRAEAELKGQIPFFASLLSKFTGWTKRGTDSKTTVRQKLEPQLSQLLDRGALLFQQGRSAVQSMGKRDLIVIVDGLDRISLKDKGNGRTSHEVLFIERGELLHGFQCHTILTVPISLMFSAQASNLGAIFPDRHILPMVKVADQNGVNWEEGRMLLKSALRKRVDVDSLFEAGVEDLLIDVSGGHPRQLMMLVRYALDFVDDAPVTLSAAEKAKRKVMNDYGRSIPEQHWPLLAIVGREHAVKNDSDHQLMLYSLSVLEYQNAIRWCDVNPAIRDLPQFIAASKKGPTRTRGKKASKIQ